MQLNYIFCEVELSWGNIVAAASSDDNDSGKTNLWHMRLGHMSELGMTELVKRELIDRCNLISLSFVSTAFLVSIKELNSMLPFIPPKAY